MDFIFLDIVFRKQNPVKNLTGFFYAYIIFNMIDKIEKDGKIIDYSGEIKIRKIDKIIFNCQKCGVEVKKEYRRWDCGNDVYSLDK